MAMSKPQKKRSGSTLSTSSSSSISTVCNNLLNCFNFLSPNEYSEKTLGILAFLTRQSVGEINFSDVIDEVEKHGQQGQAAAFIKVLKAKRHNLPEIDASIEKCLMINRYISYIAENEKRFMAIISHIRLDMKIKMTDNQIHHTIQYPNDFRQREIDFSKRKNAQNMRHLFYLNHIGAKEPPNLIYLKKRTTEHLNYLLDCKMRYQPNFRDIGLKELETILSTSFMITAHPHCGVNPVIIYDRKGHGEYTAKVSVIIVSLLHDFMQTHPNFIELYNIEPSLCPSSPYYKLVQPRSISWKTCHLQPYLGYEPQIIHYAELTFITIQQSSEKETRVHFAQALHSLKFLINVRVNLTEYRFSKTYQITLESLPFAIGQHTNQIPFLLSRVILDDIRRFSSPRLIDVKIIVNFLKRYFIHRTGVIPNDYVGIYLEEELNTARNKRKNFQTLEDIFMDFLVPFVYQVEFMAKHPILVMFYAEGLFLGICNSKRVAEVMMNSSNNTSPIVGLRLNSIQIDYDTIAKLPVSGRTIKFKSCIVRVDIYNKRTKRVQNRTFDVGGLSNDLCKFVSTATSNNANHIRILSNFDEQTNLSTLKFYTEFSKYYHKRLHKISKTDEIYRLITNIIDNVDDGDDEEIQNTGVDHPRSNSTASSSSTTMDHEQSSDTNSVYNYVSIPCRNNNNDESSSLSDQQQDPILTQDALSRSNLCTGHIHQHHISNLTESVQQPQSHLPHIQMFNQNHQSQLYEQRIHPLCQQQLSPTLIQQLQVQTIRHQQQASSFIDSCQSNNANQFQLSSGNSIDSNSQQYSTQVENLQTSENILTESIMDCFELITADQTQLTSHDQDVQLCFDELINDL